MEKYCHSCGYVAKSKNEKYCSRCGLQLSERVGREPIPNRVRHAVFQKDGYRCRECNRGKEDGAILEIDHIVPVAKGGTNDISNLQTLCKECNRGKYTDAWVGGELDSNGNIFGIKNRKEKLKLIAEKHRAEVEYKRNKLFDKFFPIVTSNQVNMLKFGNSTLEYATKKEIIRYLVNNFSADEINRILKSIDELEHQNQEFENKNGLSSFCIIKCKDIFYYYYKSSSGQYGRFYAWSEDELKKEALTNCYPWISLEKSWHSSHVDKFIDKIYLKESNGSVVIINKSSDNVTSGDLMGKVIYNLDPIKPKGFSAHGYKFCECGNKIKYYDRYCSQCMPPQELFNPIKKPRVVIKSIKCPNCGRYIKENAIRCKYCKTMLKEY